MADDVTPTPEANTSGTNNVVRTAAAAAGVVVGAAAIAVAAPIALPLVGLGALAGVATGAGAVVGGWLGWKATK